MNQIVSFPAEALPDATILILGSIPGKASLAAQQYYAHRRNQFWPIMTELLAIEPNCSYPEKILSLKLAGIALWDVVKSCQRQNSSLDTDIDKSSIVANDFAGFFLSHPNIAYLFFNGSTAEKTFQKYVKPVVTTHRLTCCRLPSTSPAHAAMSFQQKLESWRILKTVLATESVENAGKSQ
jgi:hypoxanthine-DNA glycosylase